jgi:hypothetical protein
MCVVLVSTYLHFPNEFYSGGRILKKRQKRSLVRPAFSLYWMGYFSVSQSSLLQDYPRGHFDVHQRSFLYVKAD